MTTLPAAILLLWSTGLYNAEGFSVSNQPGRRRGGLRSRPFDDELLQSVTSREFSAKLNDWKAAGEIQLWNSSLMNIIPSTTRIDVQLISRSSFSTNDYFSDIIKSMRNSQEQFSFQPLFISLCIVSFLFGSVVVPLLTIPVVLKNTLGLVGLFTPFTLLLIQSIIPNLFAYIARQYSNNTVQYQRERVIVHEAGHLMAGYLCGVVIRDYDVTGDRDAGVVAETLVFGNCRGGGEDIRMAMEILRLSQIPAVDYVGSLRWSVMKSLILLRLHRDSLDELIVAMQEGRTIAECIERIEDAQQHSK